MRTFLRLKFVDAEGKTKSILVRDPRSNLTEALIGAAMNAIIASDVFGYTGKVGAELVSVQTEEFAV